MSWMKFNHGVLEKCTSGMVDDENFLHDEIIWIQPYGEITYVDGLFTSEELRLLVDYLEKKEKDIVT